MAFPSLWFCVLYFCFVSSFPFSFFLSLLRLTSSNQGPIDRYGGIFLDEFSDLGPKAEECARILRFRVSRHPELRLVVAGYSLRSEHLQAIVGNHHLVTVSGRKYTLERCQIVSSGDKEALLQLAVDLTTVALNR